MGHYQSGRVAYMTTFQVAPDKGFFGTRLGSLHCGRQGAGQSKDRSYETASVDFAGHGTLLSHDNIFTTSECNFDTEDKTPTGKGDDNSSNYNEQVKCKDTVA